MLSSCLTARRSVHRACKSRNPPCPIVFHRPLALGWAGEIGLWTLANTLHGSILLGPSATNLLKPH